MVELELEFTQLNINIADLSLNDREKIETQCCNGEKVRWLTYLFRAAIALGLASNFDQSQSNGSKTLKELKKRIGIEIWDYQEMNPEYFSNIENILRDLNTFANLSGTTIENLSMNYKSNIQGLCSNGEKVTFSTYLNRAGIGLGLAESYSESHSKGSYILKELKRKIGINIKEYSKMDADYFLSIQNISRDLENFALKMGILISDLSTSRASTSIKCSNGEEIQWKSYLVRAAKSLDSRSIKEVLETMKRMIGIEINNYQEMDTSYFTDPKNIQEDLKAYAGIGEIRALQVFKQNHEACCVSGNFVKWITYLNRAGIALGIAATTEESQSRHAEILKELKRRIGIEIKEYPEMDSEYFNDPKNIIFDLNSYAHKMGRSVKNLPASSKQSRNIEIICSNEEKVTWLTYLSRACIGLGFASNRAESTLKLIEILKELKRRIGIETK